jgi:hypothetical protein
MGVQRNGARTFLNVLHHACKLSRLPGFTPGIGRILEPGDADPLLAAWAAVCTIVDGLVAADNYFNQLDTVNDDAAGEDTAGYPL